VSDCIFCKIASGEVPGRLLYEDEFVVAFDDIAPQGPVHTLIVTRDHYVNLNDAIPAEIAIGIMAAIPKVASIKGVADSGYRVVVNSGDDAQQTVRHLHLHLIGGQKMAHGMVRFDEGG